MSGPRPWSIRWSTVVVVVVIVVVVVVVGVWQPALPAPPGSVTSFLCLGTGYCQKACCGHSGRASLGSLSERLGMGRAGSRMASPLRSTHRLHTFSRKVKWRTERTSYIGFGEDKTF